MKDKPSLFKGVGAVSAPEDTPSWQNLRRLNQDLLDDAADYHTEDEGLVAAVNTAMSLGMPLLLTGAPGVGKTQLAYRIAYELGSQTLFFPVKSASEAQDLFYSVDHLRRLHAAQIDRAAQQNDATRTTQANPTDNQKKPVMQTLADPVDIRHFIRFHGLGLAILRAMPAQQLDQYGLRKHAWPPQENAADGYGQQQPSVVLIDEIDKAPMDFCNDMLEEIRRLQFSVPELASQPLSIYQDPDNPQEHEIQYRPQIVITSNSEKGLPEPFLRRCIYYHIQPPSKQILETIIQKRLHNQDALGTELNAGLQTKCLDFFLYLRDQARLEKAPSTAELLNWFLIMGENKQKLEAADAEDTFWLDLAGFCLLKYEKDQQQIQRHFKNWQDSQKTASGD